jgi:ferredoxin-like protein FixX
MKHLWAEPVRYLHVTYRGCMRCGMTRITRHEGVLHWVEFEAGRDGAKFVMENGCTPPCTEDWG